MLREGRFILPLRLDNGKGPYIRNEIFTDAMTKLSSEFGGATVNTSAFGYWTSPEGELIAEPVAVIDVAYEPSLENDQKLIAIATHAAIQAAQQTVYIRLASGEVTIPEVRPHSVEVAA